MPEVVSITTTINTYHLLDVYWGLYVFHIINFPHLSVIQGLLFLEMKEKQELERPIHFTTYSSNENSAK